MNSFIGVICAILIWQLWEYYKRKREEKEEITNTDAPEEPIEKSNLDILTNALRTLQCDPQVLQDEEEEGLYHINFEYQAENFMINFDNNHKFVKLMDLFWYTFDRNDLDQISNVKKIINDINWQSIVNVFYTTREDDNTFNLHTTYQMLCTDDEMFVDYLKNIFKQCFIVHNFFFRSLAAKQPLEE